MLGVRWKTETTRTQDVDVASEHMVIGVPDRNVDLRQALIDSELGFIEIPALDRRAPSTRFRIRGRQVSVDILTPMKGRTSGKPILLKSLNVYAEPVRFLDYLLVDTQPAAVVAKAGLMVNVPAPARYALHKLVLAERRIAAFQTKRTKDIDQAEQLIAVLANDRPGDLRSAWLGAKKQPAKFLQQLNASINRLTPGSAAALRKITSSK
jgi:hypothetical protein